MSEVLASLKKKGGVKPIDWASPNVEYTNANMANNATASISVTQKPRWINFFIDSTGTTYAWYGLYDVENDLCMRCGYYGNAIRGWSLWDPSTYITSVTSSAVNVKNSSGVTARMVVEIYY